MRACGDAVSRFRVRDKVRVGVRVSAYYFLPHLQPALYPYPASRCPFTQLTTCSDSMTACIARAIQIAGSLTYWSSQQLSTLHLS